MSTSKYKVRFRNTSVAFLVRDIAATIPWHVDNLGFKADAFPPSPPSACWLPARRATKVDPMAGAAARVTYEEAQRIPVSPAALFRRGRLDAEMGEQMQQHLETAAAKESAMGMSA